MVQRYFTVCGGGVGGGYAAPHTPTIGEVWRGPGTLWVPPPNLPNCQVDRVRIEPCLRVRKEVAHDRFPGRTRHALTARVRSARRGAKGGAARCLSHHHS